MFICLQKRGKDIFNISDKCNPLRQEIDENIFDLFIANILTVVSQLCYFICTICNDHGVCG